MSDADTFLAALLAASLLVASPAVRADERVAPTPQKEPSADVAAAAQTLFIEGKRLVAQGRYREGCEKLEQSHRLDAAAGTLINLADCYEKSGKVASAWIAFHDAVVEAEHSSHSDWADQAQRRASLLERIVPKLTVVVEEPVDGLTLTRDDTAIPTSAFGSPIPIDPGSYEIVAMAPGYVRWSTRVLVEGGAHVVLYVPPLVAADIPLAATVPEHKACPAPQGPISTPAPLLASPPPSSATARSAAWISVGVSAALLAGSVGALLVREANLSPYNDDNRCFYGNLTRDERCGSYRGAASTAQAFAIAGATAGAVAATTATVLFVATSRHANAQNARLDCGIGSTVVCKWTF